MLDVRNLTCERDERVLFQDLSFTLEPGVLCFIEGKNGSGKTTLLKVLCGLSLDYQGAVFWNKHPSYNFLDFQLAVFYLQHNSGIKSALTPLENLKWRTSLRHQKIKESELIFALENAGLYGYEHDCCYQLSAGQKRRVVLADMLISRASCWILDEPFSSIDQDGVAWIETLIQNHIKNSGMVLMTSHQPLSILKDQAKVVKLADYTSGNIEVDCE